MEIRVAAPEVRYVAFGDSTTAGPSARDYADLLRELLNEEFDAFAIEGQGGETTEEGLIRLRALLANALFPNAKVLLYWEAGNDMNMFIRNHDRFLLRSPDDSDYPFAEDLERQLDATQRNIESAIAAGHSAGLDVYVATYFFLRENLQSCAALPLDLVLPMQAQRANAYLVRLNERIRSAALRQAAVLVDVAELDGRFRADGRNYYDCNHLSEQGNAIVAELFFDAMTGAAD